jgi:two-component system NtrC family sensor kinase
MPSSAETARRIGLSLRAKGIVAFLAVTSYMLVFGFVVGYERLTLSRQALALERMYEQESSLSRVFFAIDNSLLRLRDSIYSSNARVTFDDRIAVDVEQIQRGLRRLAAQNPQLEKDIQQLDRGVADLRASPSRSTLIELWDFEQGLDARLAEVSARWRAERRAMFHALSLEYGRLTGIVAGLALIGTLVFGGVTMRFVGRLARDVGALEARAKEIVSGYRGKLLKVTRRDEVGRLMEAVNSMQAELRAREQKLEISREQRFHHEKMAAVGSLAAAVAHEINNPIAAIAGIARAMCDSETSGAAPSGDTTFGGSRMILAQTERIAGISRQIAEFTSPQVAEPALMDLNALVRSTCTFIGYDRRLRGVNLTLALDYELPAIVAVADHVTQVLMNLIINSADALEGLAGRSPLIGVTTRMDAGWAVLEVNDNGHGMTSDVLARAFEELFSTKPADKGRGLGLFMCKTLVERSGGQIAIASQPDVGTTVTVRIPCNSIV